MDGANFRNPQQADWVTPQSITAPIAANEYKGTSGFNRWHLFLLGVTVLVVLGVVLGVYFGITSGSEDRRPCDPSDPNTCSANQWCSTSDKVCRDCLCAPNQKCEFAEGCQCDPSNSMSCPANQWCTSALKCAACSCPPGQVCTFSSGCACDPDDTNSCPDNFWCSKDGRCIECNCADDQFCDFKQGCTSDSSGCICYEYELDTDNQSVTTTPSACAPDSTCASGTTQTHYVNCMKPASHDKTQTNTVSSFAECLDYLRKRTGSLHTPHTGDSPYLATYPYISIGGCKGTTCSCGVGEAAAVSSSIPTLPVVSSEEFLSNSSAPNCGFGMLHDTSDESSVTLPGGKVNHSLVFYANPDYDPSFVPPSNDA